LKRLIPARAVELAEAKRQLKRAVALRKTLESALEKSERHYGQLLDESQSLQEHLHRLSREILSAHEDERKRISRELHDEIGQSLTAINVKLAILKKEAAVNTKDLGRAISSTQRLVTRSMKTVHWFARELRSPVLDNLGLVPTLRAHVKGFARQTGIPVRFEAFAAAEKLDSDRRTALYRVAQEALINVARHSRASLVTVRVHKARAFVRMEIHDNGKSFDVKRRLAARTILRLGLLGMRERVEMVGGRFDVQSTPGRGTTVRAQVPLGSPGRRRARR
jgi:signal transduction histidine kinase